MARFEWRIAQDEKTDPSPKFSVDVETAAAELELPNWVAQLAVMRAESWGCTSLADLKQFMQPTLKDLPDPFLLKDMDRAVARLVSAIEQKEKIVVYGDYDVDGTIGAALLKRFFLALDFPITAYQPDRKKEGYGLNSQAVERFAAEGFKVLITVDCGISNIEEAKRAKELGLDLIVVDHHEQKDELPVAVAVLDHKRLDDDSPIENLCGAGMAFYLMMAMRKTLRESDYFANRKEPDLRSFLDLVAVATIADMVPLVQENRILAKIGLEKLRHSPTLGLRALCDAVNVAPDTIRTYHVGFVLGPRINASGRLGSASLALELLCTEDPAQAQQLAAQLNSINRERVEVQKRIEKEAAEQGAKLIEQYGTDLPALVLSSSTWHEGVIGIVASRMVEMFQRPVAIVSFEYDPTMGKGSVRSKGQVDILSCMEKCADKLERFGGHKAAAGLAITPDNLEAFRTAFADAVGDTVEEIRGPGKRLMPLSLAIDLDVSTEQIDMTSVHQLESLAPFGIGNPEPVVTYRNLSVRDKRLLKEEHLKLKVEMANKRQAEALWFFAHEGHELDRGDRVDLAFSPQISSFRGVEKLEFRIRDLKTL